MTRDYIIPAVVNEAGTELRIDSPLALQRAKQAHAGQRVELVIRKLKTKRSRQANNWHWGVAVPQIADALGYDRHEYEQVHYALVAKCFGVTVDPKSGLEIPNKRSSQLSTAEFSELMEWEVRYAAQEWGVVIPLPSEAA